MGEQRGLEEEDNDNKEEGTRYPSRKGEVKKQRTEEPSPAYDLLNLPCLSNAMCPSSSLEVTLRVIVRVNKHDRVSTH